MNDRRTPLQWTSLASLVVLSLACGKREAPDEPGSRVAIDIAPLELDEVSDATWRITVTNRTGDTVFTVDASADQYGDGRGSVSYVGPCDASDGENPNTVSLSLVALEADGGRLMVAGVDYVDPGVMTREVPCDENADVPVTFDVTLMLRAKQGFIDATVDFDDIFCSAKLDCKDELLHTPDGGRGPTVLMTFACASGENTPTWLYLGDVSLTCTDANPLDEVVLAPLSVRLSPGAASDDGQQGALPPILYQWARYADEEELPDLQKCYWNHAFGLDLAAIGQRRCTLTATGTAAAAELPLGALPDDAVYPVVTWAVEVVGPGGALCENNGLDATGSGVRTGYHHGRGAGTATLSFAAERACHPRVVEVEPLGFSCSDTSGALMRPTIDTTGNAAVAVTIGGVPAPVDYALPAGTTLAQDCCRERCCLE